jgi:hypothetical protein
MAEKQSLIIEITAIFPQESGPRINWQKLLKNLQNLLDSVASFVRMKFEESVEQCTGLIPLLGTNTWPLSVPAPLTDNSQWGFFVESNIQDCSNQSRSFSKCRV